MRRGFTLVEIMIGVILSSIVMGAGFQIWSSARRDLTTANMRQTLQHDIRISLDRMASDFKSMKAGTLTDPVQSGQSFSFALDRYIADKDGKPTNKTAKVIWEFNEASHMLCRTESGGDYDGKRIMSVNLVGLDVARGSGSELQVKGGGMTGVTDDSESGRSARFDITMDGEKKNTMTGKTEKHTEKVSVFVRDEYYTAITKGKHLKIRELTATESGQLTASKIDSKESFFAKNISDEMLAGMSKKELEDLKTKEKQIFEDTQKKLNDVNSYIDQIDSKKSFLWIFSKSTATSKIQDNIVKHDTKAQLEQDIKDLNKVIESRETEFIGKSLKSGESVTTIMNDPEKAKVYKEAYEFMIRKRNLENNIKGLGDDAKNADQKKELQATLDNMNSQIQNPTITKGADESPEAYAARQARITQVMQTSSKMDLNWMNDAGDDVKEYEAAKQVMDLAQAKISCVEGRDSAQANLVKIDEFLGKAKS